MRSVETLPDALQNCKNMISVFTVKHIAYKLIGFAATLSTVTKNITVHSNLKTFFLCYTQQCTQNNQSYC